jgi:hypothetical protein
MKKYLSAVDSVNEQMSKISAIGHSINEGSFEDLQAERKEYAQLTKEVMMFFDKENKTQAEVAKLARWKELRAKFGDIEIKKEERKANSLKLNSTRYKDAYVALSEKGAVSIYGLRRFPMTVYLEEIKTILDNKDVLEKFIAENKEKFSVKPPKEAKKSEVEKLVSSIKSGSSLKF